MERYEISRAEYSKALTESSDDGYLAHLVNDFIITHDGRVVARLGLDKQPGNVYVIRDRFKLFSSL